MTLSDLIAQFRFETSDLDRKYLWDDDELTVYLNEAQDEACIRSRLIREKTNPTICQIDVVENVSIYQLDPHVIEIVYGSMIYLGAEGLPYILGKTTSDVMDQIRPYWRSLHYRPTALIHYDTSVEFDCIPDTSYTVNLEVYRLPMVPMSSDDDIPEINAIHHRHLVKWAKHRAYAKRDADTYNEGLSEKYLTEFEDVFGKRPNAAYRKGANANRPHRNMVW